MVLAVTEEQIVEHLLLNIKEQPKQVHGRKRSEMKSFVNGKVKLRHVQQLAPNPPIAFMGVRWGICVRPSIMYVLWQVIRLRVPMIGEKLCVVSIWVVQ